MQKFNMMIVRDPIVDANQEGSHQIFLEGAPPCSNDDVIDDVIYFDIFQRGWVGVGPRPP